MVAANCAFGGRGADERRDGELEEASALGARARVGNETVTLAWVTGLGWAFLPCVWTGSLDASAFEYIQVYSPKSWKGLATRTISIRSSTTTTLDSKYDPSSIVQEPSISDTERFDHQEAARMGASPEVDIPNTKFTNTDTTIAVIAMLLTVVWLGTLWLRSTPARAEERRTRGTKRKRN